ncbi:MAG: flagellar motor switch phosphatase FliY [Oscillospiraceae bacterium]
MANLSQDEINALLQGGDDAGERLTEDISKYFSPDEIDALGEIGNICIGTSATTMSALVGRRVKITTPKVGLFKGENVLTDYKCPFMAIDVEYTSGFHGKNLLIIKDYDAAVITDLMMGGDGVVEKENIELDEIHLSAMSEVMNQMIGSAATAMSNMMEDSVNISTPQILRIAIGEDVGKYFDGASPIVKISFDMEIEDLLKSKLLQIMTIDIANELITSLMKAEDKKEVLDTHSNGDASVSKAKISGAAGIKNTQPSQKQEVKVVKPVSYPSFDEPSDTVTGQISGKSNFDLINDIPLQVTVELGKAVKNLNEVLNFGTGSIIVLDKQAGELVDVIVNGKYIAKGEVVVIDDNYGVRITEILKT